MFKATIITALVGSAFAMEYAQHSYNFPDDETDRVEQCGNVVTQMRKRHDPKFRAEDVKETKQGVLGQATVSPTVSELANEIAEECKEHAQTHDALAEESEFSKLFPGMDFAFGDLESQEVCDYADYEEDKGIFTNISFDRNHEEFKKIPNKHRALCSAILDLYTGKFSQNEKFVGKNHLERSWAKETDFTIYFSFIENDHERETTGSDPLSIYGRFRQTNDTPLPLSEPIGFRHDGQLIEVKPYGLCPRHDFERARDITTQQGNHTLKCYVNFQVKVVGRRKPFIFRALAQMDFGWN